MLGQASTYMVNLSSGIFNIDCTMPLVCQIIGIAYARSSDGKLQIVRKLTGWPFPLLSDVSNPMIKCICTSFYMTDSHLMQPNIPTSLQRNNGAIPVIIIRRISGISLSALVPPEWQHSVNFKQAYNPFIRSIQLNSFVPAPLRRDAFHQILHLN